MKDSNKKENFDKDKEEIFDIRDLDKEEDLDISPKEMQELLKNTEGGDIPAPMTIKVKYSKELECLTGKNKEDMIMSLGAPFEFLLQSIFSSYPEIFKRYKPGKLGFHINGKPPKNFSPLLDGDEVEFFVL